MLSIRVTRALSDFTLDVDVDCPYMVTAVFGPSGSGKTSLLNLVAGLLRPDRGEIVHDDDVCIFRITDPRAPCGEDRPLPSKIKLEPIELGLWRSHHSCGFGFGFGVGVGGGVGWRRRGNDGASTNTKSILPGLLELSHGVVPNLLLAWCAARLRSLSGYGS